MRQLSRKEWPYQVRFDTKTISVRDDESVSKLKWLFDYFRTEEGKSNDDWNYTNIGPFMMVYCFKRVEDYEWFVLRWGSGDY